MFTLNNESLNQKPLKPLKPQNPLSDLFPVLLEPLKFPADDDKKLIAIQKSLVASPLW